MSSTGEPTLKSPLQSEVSENVYTKPAQTLASGIVSLIGKPLNDTKKQLKELETKQEELIERLHKENLSVAEVQYSQELQAMFTSMKLYHTKLQIAKKDIKGLHERSLKLKKRALKLTKIKEKEPQEEIIISRPTTIITQKDAAASSQIDGTKASPH